MPRHILASLFFIAAVAALPPESAQAQLAPRPELPQALPNEAFLDQALEPPKINTAPGAEYADEARKFAMIIGMDRTPKGRLWACWVAGGDDQHGYFVAATSDDDGATWSKPKLVVDPVDPPGAIKRRTLVGNFWTDPSGKLWLFFDQSMGYFDGRAGVWATVCADPDADKPQWSPPRRIWHGCTLNKPTVLQNGEWLLPISLWDRGKIAPAPLRGAFADLDDFRMAHLFVSTDHGETWTRRGGVAFPHSEFDEHMTVELKDGRLWMLARTTYGAVAEAFSRDHGQTWSLPQPSAIRNINSRFFIRRLASGNLLLVKNGPVDTRAARREKLTAYLSDDDGKTWKGGLVVDERATVSYPDGFQAPDGSLYILYDYNRATDAEILLAKFQESDVLAGKFQSPGFRERQLVNKALGGEYAKQASEDAKQDRQGFAYDGISPNKLVCDTTLRLLPDGSWGLLMLAGGETEPSPQNYTGIVRSRDEGKTWTKIEAVDLGLPRSGDTIGQGPTELIVRDGICTLFFSTHAHTWGEQWQSWISHSDDSCTTFSKPVPAPGRLAKNTFLRNHIVARDGRIIVPVQHYLGPPAGATPPPERGKRLAFGVSDPRNGVLISKDGGKTWSEHGNIRLTTDDRYHGWAENNIVELTDGRIAMIIRADRLGGVLFYAESPDGGLTWPEFAKPSDIPNPGSKAVLHPLGGNVVAMLHNPNPKHRSPLALWISFDGLKTWPYRRVLVPESSDGPQGRLNYPDGFVSADREWLHFAYDDNRHRAAWYSAKLPPLPDAPPPGPAKAVAPAVEAKPGDAR